MHRLPKNQSSYVDVVSDHYKVRAAFGGEQHVDGFLKRMRWNDSVIVIADFQLRERFCYLDTLLLTLHQAIIKEEKNYSGILSFDEESSI